jgi:hypothetical protein
MWWPNISYISSVIQHIFLPQYEIQSSSQHVAPRYSSSCCRKCTHPRSNHVMRWQKNVNHYICYTTCIFQRNTKFNAGLSMSQLVMSSECIHPRFKLCNMTTKNFCSLYCNTTYIFHRDKKFKARHSTSQYVHRSSSCHMNVHIHDSNHEKWWQNISFITSVIQHVFFAAIRHSKIITARRSSSYRKTIHMGVTRHVMDGKNNFCRINKKSLYWVVFNPTRPLALWKLARPLPGWIWGEIIKIFYSQKHRHIIWFFLFNWYEFHGNMSKIKFIIQN